MVLDDTTTDTGGRGADRVKQDANWVNRDRNSTACYRRSTKLDRCGYSEQCGKMRPKMRQE